MKHNWEYRPLGEVCKLSAGGDKPAEVSKEKTSVNTIPVYSNGIENDGLYGYCRSAKIFNSALTISGRGTIGYPSIKREPFVPIIRLIVAEPKEKIKLDYLYYWVVNRRFSGNGAAIPQLTVPMIKNELVPVPPMEVQEGIVAELDRINEIIADCKEAISNLDSLAQSLFYDYFGDPITNPKGWEVVKLGETSEITSSKRVLVQDIVDEGIPFIRGTELAILAKQNGYDRNVFTMFISPEHYESVKAITGVPELNDLLIPSINPDGLIWEVITTDSLYFKDGRVLWVHVNHTLFNSTWLKFSLSKTIKDKYSKLSGAVFAELTLVLLRNLEMTLPPLSLQEKFASRIGQIEQQKKDLEETIANMQTLLDSRMDYWFN